MITIISDSNAFALQDYICDKRAVTERVQTCI